MPYTALSDDISTLSQFTRRKAIAITTGGTSTPVDYQVKLTITYEPGMQADFDDIRFNTLAGGYIDYWIESHTASTTATVWIELTDAIADPGSDTIWMYFGNTSISNSSNIGDTFLFSDDFPGDSIDTDKWDGDTADTTVSGGIMSMLPVASKEVRSIAQFDTDIAIGIRIRVSTGTLYKNYWGMINPVNTHFAFAYVSYVPENYIYTKDGVNTNKVSTNWPLDSWYVGDMCILGGVSVRGFSNGVEVTGSPAATYPPDSSELEMIISARDTDGIEAIECDWVFARKCITNEPTLLYGTVQHQRRTPQFIG